MAAVLRYFLLPLLLSIGLVGCYMKPVRHLASDVALVQVGKSTKEDVTIYLGEADDIAQDKEGRELWHYRDLNTNLLQKAPLVGKSFGSPEIVHVVVTFTGGLVSSCDFSLSDADDLSWAKDFSWQENKK